MPAAAAGLWTLVAASSVGRAAALALPEPQHVITVVPTTGGDGRKPAELGRGERSRQTVSTVHGAAAAVRTVLATSPAATVEVRLLPGVHQLGGDPLVLGPADGAGTGGRVTWRSSDIGSPAVFGAPIRVRGWKPHVHIKGAYTAPLPANIDKGSSLRQLWVDGLRADRPRVHGTGLQQGDNKMGHCLNLTNASSTKLYPEGSAYDFAQEPNVVDPSKWPNPEDVEFLYTGCDAINCWVEPRCTVQKVEGNLVYLKQNDNASCYHRLYHWDHCLNYNNGQDGSGRKPRNPTSIENVATNFTQPGQFYYDRAAATISYILRAGESASLLDETATTTQQQELLVVNGSNNVHWEHVSFEYATFLGTSGPKGFVDTQSAYLCNDGEPPVNVHIFHATNVTFRGCRFQHLGGVYALGAQNASQNIIVSNCTFTDCSGGAVKLGNVGERGAPAPSASLDPTLQDRGYLISDNFIHDMPVEYSGANPIFLGYTADATVAYNTIHHSSYSAICAGWGWGMGSYMRGIEIVHNSIVKPMQPNARGQLEDGGCVYTNTPCPNCSVSHNYFEGDPTVYGCIYHDGGSGLWNDHYNVFNHIETAAVFAHGSSAHTTVVDMWLNDTHNPQLEGDTNRDVRDPDGNCINATMNFSRTPHGDDLFRIYTGPWKVWPAPAQRIIDQAGRRSIIPSESDIPPLSPPITPDSYHVHDCAAPPAPAPKPGPPPGPSPPPPPPKSSFAATKCVKDKLSQQWKFWGNAIPGNGTATNVQSAMPGPLPGGGCWEIAECRDGGGINCKNGCKNLPAPGSPQGCPSECPSKSNICDYNGLFRFNHNGTITTGMDMSCVTVSAAGAPILMAPCDGKAHQGPFNAVRVKSEANHYAAKDVYTIQLGDLCIDNDFN